MKRVLDKTYYNFDKKEIFKEVIIISLLSLLIPLLGGKIISLIFGDTSVISNNSNFIVGTITTSLLIVSALNLNGLKRVLLPIIMPGVGLILSEVLFGTFNTEMLYLLPILWLSNFAFVYLIKLLLLDKGLNYFLTLIVALIVKICICFGIFYILNACGLFSHSDVDNIKYLIGAIEGISTFIGIFLGYIILTSYRLK